MKIVMKKLDDIKEASYNPRIGVRQNKEFYKKLKGSIDRFGLVQPLVWNKRTNTVVGGHQRLQILRDEGISEVECIEVDLTDEDEKALNLSLNKIGGDWDTEMLNSLLSNLKDLDYKNMDITGFDEKEINEIFDQFREPKEEQFEIPKTSKYNVQRGEVYQLGNHRLMCGDSTIKDDVLHLMDGKKADVGVTDPPYGVRKDDWDKKFIDSVETWFKNYREITKYGLIWFCADKMLPFLINEKGFERLLIWNKPPGSQFAGASNNNIWYSNEPILVYTFNKIMNNFDENIEYSYSVFESRTIQENKEGHPTTKPLDLMIWIITHYSKKHQLILDLFGGSGSTLIACEQTNRICYMMEIDPYYCSVIIERWENYTGKKHEKVMV